MSCNRENVIWQSKDGTWNRGYFECWPVGQDSDDWDYEWDVEYGGDFSTVYVGLTLEEANRAVPGANPGGYDGPTAYSEDPAYCDRLDETAREAIERGNRAVSLRSRTEYA